MDISKVVEALNIIYHPLSTQEQRLSATKYCEEFKTKLESIPWVHQLVDIKYRQNDVVRHFGLLMLEECLKFRWNEYDDSNKELVRNLLLDLATNGLDGQEEKDVIKRKVARLLSLLMVNDWPLKWQNANSYMLNLYLKSKVHEEVCLLTYHDLGQDLDEFYESTLVMTTKKRKLIRINLLRFLIGTRNFDEYYDPKTYGKEVSRLEEDNEGWVYRWIHSIKLLSNISGEQKRLVLTLDALNVFLEWLLPELLTLVQIPFTFFPLLANPNVEIQAATLRCLSSYIKRNFHTQEHRIQHIFQPFFGGIRENHAIDFQISGVYVLSKWLEKSKLLLEEDETIYTSFKLAASILAELGTTQICNKKNQSAVPANFSNYLNVMLELTKSPSLEVEKISMSMFFSLIRHEYIRKCEEFIDILEAIISIVYCNIGRLSSSWSHSFYESVDYEYNEGALRVAKQRVLNLHLDFLGSITELYPNELLTWASSCIRVNEEEKSFSVVSKVMEVVVGVVMKDEIHEKLTEEANNICVSIFESLILMASSGQERYCRSIELLSLFIPLLKSNQSYLGRFLTLIFEGFSNLPSSEEHQKLASILSKLGTALPDNLVPIFNDILGACSNLCLLTNIRSSEIGKIFSFLTKIPFQSTTLNFNEREDMVRRIMSPTLQEWDRIKITITSRNEFCKFCGLDILEEIVSQVHKGTLSESEALSKYSDVLEQTIQYRQKTSKILSIFSSLCSNLKRNQNDGQITELELKLFFPYYELILEGITNLVRCLHSMNCLSFAANKSQEIQSALIMTEKEKRTLVATSMQLPSSSSLKFNSDLEQHVVRLSNYFFHTKDTCYIILGMISRSGPLFCCNENFLEVVYNALFTGEGENEDRSINYIPIYHWRFLIDILFSKMNVFVSNFPVEGFGGLADSFIMPPMMFLEELLRKEWELYYLHMQKEGEDKETVSTSTLTKDEIDRLLQAKILREFSLDLLGMISLFVDSSKLKHKEIEKKENIQSFFINYSRLIQPVLSIVCFMLNAKDGITCRKSISIIQDILYCSMNLLTEENKGKQELLFKVLGSDILVACLKSFNDGYFADIQDELLTLISDLYIHIRPKSEIPYHVMRDIGGIDERKLQEFESEVFGEKNPKNQRAMTHNFIIQWKGHSLSQLYTYQNIQNELKDVGKNFAHPQKRKRHHEETEMGIWA